MEVNSELLLFVLLIEIASLDFVFFCISYYGNQATKRMVNLSSSSSDFGLKEKSDIRFSNKGIDFWH